MDTNLLSAARAAREKAYAPYSDFAVGAALKTASGAVYAGGNVENASYPEGWCAETSAIAAMVAGEPAGAKPHIAEVCVVANTIDGRLTSPCGGCRQRLAEFADAQTLVHLVSPEGEQATYRMGELLPAAFDMTGEA